ncbi:hypothetical protein E2C01_078258 [Portunus trituberculatus]|uniref:Uncharacterized protein n=1 Tax=Portunus trituberculatus TaxID=210409 RepID=A0A5B7IPM2_PORTR|nr:hypothetical protein [Portunus trituberculatus]
MSEINVVTGAYPITFARVVFNGFSTHLSGRYTCNAPERPAPAAFSPFVGSFRVAS